MTCPAIPLLSILLLAVLYFRRCAFYDLFSILSLFVLKLRCFILLLSQCQEAYKMALRKVRAMSVAVPLHVQCPP